MEPGVVVVIVGAQKRTEMQTEDSSDGFVTIGKGKVGRPRRRDDVTFLEHYAAVKIPDCLVDAEFADWQWNGNGTLRLRVGAGGTMRLSVASNHTRSISTVKLQKTLGRQLRGGYPMRVEGRDIYVEIGSEKEEAPR